MEVGHKHHPPRLRADGGQGQSPHPPVGGQHLVTDDLLLPRQHLGTSATRGRAAPVRLSSSPAACVTEAVALSRPLPAWPDLLPGRDPEAELPHCHSHAGGGREPQRGRPQLRVLPAPPAPRVSDGEHKVLGHRKGWGCPPRTSCTQERPPLGRVGRWISRESQAFTPGNTSTSTTSWSCPGTWLRLRKAKTANSAYTDLAQTTSY